ncbi:MAG: peptidoglycan-binding domain-containing protein [Candidatus Omnitrophica bacterium]|nr:peptidoglycan-binding domain-containing protein [Candidatus Omnitrophota bacterium]
MNKAFLMIAVAALVIMPLAVFGCKGKVEKAQGLETSAVMPEAMTPAGDTLATPEPSQVVATETIPPSAAPQLSTEPVVQPVKTSVDNRNKDIQTALKNAGFYAGSIDGKIGPKTKKAIGEFQKSKGLKADGKVGPKTWAELEKYLVQQ